MCPIVAAGGVELDCAVAGEGPAVVLLIHGLAQDREALAPVADGLAAAGVRVVTYSRRGYGASTAPEPYRGTTVAEQTEDAVAVARKLAPDGALVVGLDFGALVALDLLTRHGDLAGGAVLADPPLFALVPEATREVADWNERLREAVADGGPAAGVAAYLGERGTPADRERAESAHAAFYADVAGLATLPVTRAGLRAISAPVVVVTSPASTPATVQAADALAALVPAAARATDGDLAPAIARARRRTSH